MILGTQTSTERRLACLPTEYSSWAVGGDGGIYKYFIRSFSFLMLVCLSNGHQGYLISVKHCFIHVYIIFMTWPARECSNLMTNHRFLPAATFLVGFVEDATTQKLHGGRTATTQRYIATG